MDPERLKKDRSATRIPTVDGLHEAIADRAELEVAVRLEPAGVPTNSSSEVEIIPGKRRRAEQVLETKSIKRPRRLIDFLPTE